jgi:serine/threonine-protein kinase
MATVHVGRLLGPSGFSRRVAIKRLHPQLAANEEIAAMFAAEARLSARITHANVVPVLDVVSAEGELLLVMEYVHGDSLSRLLAHARGASGAVPVGVVVAVICHVLHGLHAAHEATGEDGAPLRLVHRDISPQNVLVGADGVARVVDFGIAKALGQGTITRDGPLRGKLPYMAPEQLLRRSLDRRVDVWAAGVVMWEALTGRRLFEGDDEPTLFSKVLEEPVPAPSTINWSVSKALDAIVLRALERDPDRRFPDAHAMAVALEEAEASAPASAVAEWVTTNAAETLAKRQEAIAAMERDVRSESSEPSAPAIRAPFASVFLKDAESRPVPKDEEAAGAPAKSEASTETETAPSANTSRRRLALAGGAGLVVAASVVTAIVVARSPSDTGTAAAASAPPSSVASVDDSAPSATGSAPVVVAASPSASPAARAPSSTAKGAVGVRWCKVFDPDKQIFVMRSMRVARCP